jgi:TPR repeat protein
LFEFGKGVAQSRVQAHMWYSIAVLNGNKAAAFWRDSLAVEPYEILTAQILVQECLSSRYSNCGE